MSRHTLDPPGAINAACGYLLLGGGFLVVGSLVLTGVVGAMRDEPDMADLHQVWATPFCGFPAVIAILAGFHVRRRGWR